jgi:hypothetical protein
MGHDLSQSAATQTQSRIPQMVLIGLDLAHRSFQLSDMAWHGMESDLWQLDPAQIPSRIRLMGSRGLAWAQALLHRRRSVE